MSKPSQLSLSLLVLATTLALGGVVSSTAAEAQVRPGRAAVAATGAKATKGTKQALVKEFSVRPHANVQRKIGNKPLLHISGTNSSAYGKHLDHSVEMIFKPMGTTGHSYLRVGRKIYDFAYIARANEFKAPTGNAYGFVMATTPAKIQKLQQGFNQLMARDPNFSMTGTGHNNTFSCAGFLSYVLKKHAPELGIGLTPSAIGMASRLMRGQADAVTIYGGTASELASGSFEFKLL
jgi:hypothetical protein